MIQLDKDTLELSYLAGFFDGEGCITIAHSQRGIYGTYQLCILVGQKDKAPLIDFQNRFGGAIGKPNSTFHWVIHDKKALLFLETMLPYLRYKKQQAEIGIKFIKGCIGTNKKLPRIEIKRREDLYWNLKEIKKRDIEFTKKEFEKIETMDKYMLELSYLAGFLDAEGCITVISRRPNVRQKSGSYVLKIVITQKSKAPLVDFQNRFGGTINKLGKLRTGFQWCVHHKNAAIMLESILPYLKYKKEQAELGIEFIKKSISPVKSRGSKLVDGETDRRESLYLKIRQLNNANVIASDKWAQKYKKRIGENNNDTTRHSGSNTSYHRLHQGISSQVW